MADYVMVMCDDEDWYDDVDESDDDEVAPCPECGQALAIVTDKCPACGYWLTAADRRALRTGTNKPLWLRATAWVVLAIFLFSLLAAGAAIL